MKTSPLVRTLPSLSGNIHMIVDSAYNVTFAPLVDVNDNNSEFASTKDSYATNAVNVWNKLRYGKNEIFGVSNSDIKTVEPTTSLENQYDWQYVFGTRHSTKPNTYQCFAPLWIDASMQLPQWFLVFRCKDIDTDLKTLMRSSKLIAKYDLSKINELTSHVEQMSLAPMYYSHSTLQHHRLWGFDIKQSKYVEVDVGSVATHEEEQDPIQFAMNITEAFSLHSCMCSQLVNITFKFTDNVDGIYRYVGVYANWCDSNIVYETDNLKTLKHSTILNDSLNVIQYVDYNNSNAQVNQSIELLPAPIDYTRLYKEIKIASFDENDGIRPNVYTQQRSISFRFIGNMEPGESFTILVNGEIDLQVYCEHEYAPIADSRNFFVRKHTLHDTIQAFVKAFEWYALNKSAYAYTLKQNKDNSFTVYTNANSNDVVMQLNVSPYSVSALSLHNFAMPWKSCIEFDAAITTSNSIIVTKAALDYIKQANYILLHLPSGDIKTQIIRTATVESVIDNQIIDSNANNYIIVMLDAVLPEFTESIAFDLLMITRATTHLIQLYDLYDFDAYFWNPREHYMTNTEFDLQSWYSWMKSNIALNIKDVSLQAQYYSVLENFYANAKVNESVHAVKSLSYEASNAEYSTSEYAKTHSLSQYAQENKQLIKWTNWCALNGSDSMNKELIANTAVNFHVMGLAPYESYANYDIDSFAFSWFVEGFTMPEYIATLDIQNRKRLCKSYATATITLDDLHSTYTNAFDKLVHTFRVTDSTFETVCAYEYTKPKPGTTNAYVLFKGVEYTLSSNFIGWKFAVIHIDGPSSFVSSPQFIANYKWQFCCIVLPFKVVDTALTSLDGAMTYQLDKSMFYCPLGTQVVKSLDDVIADVSFRLNNREMIGNWLIRDESGAFVEPTPKYGVFRYFDGDGKNPPLAYYAVECNVNTTEYSITDLYKIGDTCKVDTIKALADGSKLKVHIEFRNIVQIVDNIIWCNDVYIVKASSTPEHPDEFGIWRHMTNPTIPDDAPTSPDVVPNEEDNPNYLAWLATSCFSYDYAALPGQETFYFDSAIAILATLYVQNAVTTISATTTVSSNRFVTLAYSTMFNKLNSISAEISVASKTIQQIISPVKYESSINMLVTLTRYGTYIMPHLFNVTNFNAIKSGNELYDNASLLQNATHEVSAYQLLDQIAYEHNIETYDDVQIQMPVKYTLLDLLSTNLSNIYAKYNEQTQSFENSKYTDTWIELPLLAARCIGMTTTSIEQSYDITINNVVKLDLISILQQCLPLAVLNDKTISSAAIANMLLHKFTNINISFTDSIGLNTKPIKVEWTSLQYYIATFESSLAQVNAKIEFA